MSQKSILGILLNHGILKRHFSAYLIIMLVSSSYLGMMGLLQPGLLDVMGIPQSQHGLITGGLSAFQELITIVLVGFICAYSDKIGRKSVYIAGLLITAVGFALYPYATSIAELFAYRLIVAIGLAAIIGMMLTIITDYADNRTRGKANGLQGLLSTLGAFITPAVGSLLIVFQRAGHAPLEAQKYTFGVAASLGLIAALVAFFGLAGRKLQVAAPESESIFSRVVHGWRARKDPAIALSYGAAFISRGDLAVTSAFLSLWVVQYGIGAMGLTAAEATQELAVPRVLVLVSGALFGSIAMGYICDKVSRVTAVSIASGLAATAYIGVFLFRDPSSGWFFILMFAIGVAEISAFVSSQALVGQQAPSKRRASIIGFFGMTGAVGILLGTAGGGWVFSNVGPAAPFVIFGFLNLLVFIWSLWVRKLDIVIPADTSTPNQGV